MACRGELFGTLLRQEVAFFDKEEVGVLTSRLGSDCQAVVRALSTNINVALRNALQAIGEPAWLSSSPCFWNLIYAIPAALAAADVPACASSSAPAVTNSSYSCFAPVHAAICSQCCAYCKMQCSRHDLLTH